MAFGSKQKGSRFELAISKYLSELFGMEFRRTPNSGAYTGGKNRKNATNMRGDVQEILSGDIIAPKNFPYLIECKSYKDKPSFTALINGRDATFDKWLNQNKNDAEFVEKRPLLFFKINFSGEYAVFRHDDPFLLRCPDSYFRYGDYVIFSIKMFETVLDISNIFIMLEE